MCVIYVCLCVCVCVRYLCVRYIYCTCNFKGISGTRFVVNEFNLTGCPLIISLNAKRTVAAVNKQSNRTTLHSGVKWDIDCVCVRVCARVYLFFCV